jgi:thiol-disulfide isomerase/thioredoxin
MDENQHQITSTHQFQSLLSQDLTRVSLLYFWAPWAAPCKQMTDVVSALAGKYTAALLTLQIEADVHEEITESFEIENVPSFIVLRVRAVDPFLLPNSHAHSSFSADGCRAIHFSRASKAQTPSLSLKPSRNTWAPRRFPIPRKHQQRCQSRTRKRPKSACVGS